MIEETMVAGIVHDGFIFAFMIPFLSVLMVYKDSALCCIETGESK